MKSSGNLLPWYLRPLAHARIESPDGRAFFLCITPRLIGKLFGAKPRIYSLTEKPAARAVPS